ncbi:MAG: hypothetical protein Q7R91_01710 [bacterium]|nr:hypothetical protein [bacterium]
MFLIAAGVFMAFAGVYAFLTAAVIHHLYHYTMAGWTAVRFVVPIFFFLSAIFFAFATYFFLHFPWQALGN